MATIAEALAVAVQHHQAGRLQAAEQIYRQILAVAPDHADALHLLGVIAAQAGQHAVAAEYIRRAIALNGNVAAFHNNLGGAYRALQQAAEAAACYRRALELKPDYVDAHSNLGLALWDMGKPDEALACWRRALELNPDFTPAHVNLGNALKDQGKFDEALACYRRMMKLKPDDAAPHYHAGIVLQGQGKLDEAVACYRRALELRPDFAAAHNNLGNVLWSQGKPDEAIACYRRAVELKPDLAQSHNNLGNALKEQGKLADAIACYRRALELDADYAEAHNNLGNALKDQDKLDDAVACYRRALALRPDFTQAHNNLGNALKELGNLGEAIACHQRALELDPDYAEAYYNLGNALKARGEPDDAVACYRRALELKPDYALAHDNLLYALQYCAGVTPAALAEAHAEYDRRHAAPLRGDPPRRSRDRHAPLRVGFVSPDLGRHPVGYFLVRVLENLDQAQFETVCYSDRLGSDNLTCRLQAVAAQWRDVPGTSNQRLAEQIRADRIDILFDLAGHTGRNRLLVFARKPAPVQITWIGYEGTTGLAAMDYLLADRYVIPEGSEQYYRERVLRMPDGYLCYDPPEAAPPAGPLPAGERGHVTFGSFNNPAKITAEVVAVWAEILRRCPAARLALKYREFGDSTVKQRYLELFAARDVAPQRLDLLPASSYAEYLATYQKIDIVLDPFPFSGGTTTCEALWMGVPVVTCPGETFASRHSLSHLSNVGLTETIAGDLNDYVELALSLAGDLPRLAALRAGLRQRMAVSPLCDRKRFASNLAALLRDVWQRHA